MHSRVWVGGVPSTRFSKPTACLRILLSIPYLSVSLANNSNSRGNLCCIDYYLKYLQVNDNSKTNSSKIPSSVTRGRKFPIYSILYIEKYCEDSLGMIGILFGYYIRLSYFDNIY